jgi:hypothetical protein
MALKFSRSSSETVWDWWLPGVIKRDKEARICGYEVSAVSENHVLDTYIASRTAEKSL